MLGDPSGLFAIDEDTGEITLAAGKELDFESGTTSYPITLTVTPTSALPDGGESSAAEVLDYTIQLENLDDNAPVFAAASLATGSTFAVAPDTMDTRISVISGVGEDLKSSDNTVLFIVSASDADNVMGQTATDTIIYSLAAMVEDNKFFTFDPSTGEVTLKANEMLNVKPQ